MATADRIRQARIVFRTGQVPSNAGRLLARRPGGEASRAGILDDVGGASARPSVSMSRLSET